ncbi:sigma factor-like helix-turn-helix DNA-binding protein [Auraticoccus cholistanensis]|nr:sigma factor-like helix-turn-helix DNA-binding protein [Auraticoccus cholistanensis]
MTSASARKRPSCVDFADLFQHPVMDEGLPAGAGPDERRQAAMMVRKAQNLCESCPLLKSCLYDAVVKHDVSGYVAQTTQRQRAEIRRRLGVTVTPEDFDTLAGVTSPNRQVDHEEVLRLRRANPDESLETLAHRLGCSLSTVKRHLRRARTEASTPRPAPARRPSPEQVAAVAQDVVSGTGRRPRVAA